MSSTPRPSVPASGHPDAAHTGLWSAALVVATLVAYLPALRAGILWDDDGHLTRADLASVHGLFRIWFEPGATQQYYPVLHSAFWFENAIWGHAAFGYHLLNVALHATAACLFARVLLRLAVPGAWLAAAFFALHPVSVESVAWISEQKNTLSAVFYLAAALAYLRFDTIRAPRSYALASGLFLLALLTKTVTATLPAALLVVLWWKRGRLNPRRDLLPVLPWFAAGAAVGLFTAHFEHALIGAQGSDFAFNALERGLIAGRVPWFYLGKLLWPGPLVFIYPRWTIDATAAWQWLFPLAALALLAGLAWHARRSRAPLAAALFFGGSLFPVLGFVNVYPFLFSFVADHFQYVASLGVFALAGAGLGLFASRMPVWHFRFALGAMLAVLAALTWRQAGQYHDNEALFTATLARNPACWMAHNNLGNVLAASNRAEHAIAHFRRALELRPGFAEAGSNLGDQLNKIGRPAEALPYLQRAVEWQPKFASAHNNLGLALVALDRLDDGVAAFKAAIALEPARAQFHFNLAMALATRGRHTEALPLFAEAARLEPNFADAHVNWANALTLDGRMDEALAHYQRALELRPDVIEIRFNYGRALARVGRTDEAITQFRAATEIEPASAAAHVQLALALRAAGRLPEAERAYAEAQRLGRPDPRPGAR